MEMSAAIKRRMHVGIRVGLAVATVMSGWGLLGQLFGERYIVAERGTDIASLVLSYLAAGIVGGAIIGWLLPAGKSIPGKMFLGVLASLILFFCVQSARRGPVWIWDRKTVLDTTLIAVVFGIIGGPWAARGLK